MPGYDYDFNNADRQQFGDLIPNGTFVKVIMTIEPGGVGPEGWLTKSQSSDAQYLKAEFTVMEGPFANRKFWENMTFSGGKLNDKGQSIAGEITRAKLRAILESSRNIQPTDSSEQAMTARRVQSFHEFDGIVFAAKIGIEKGKDGYDDKNKITAVITPDKKEYQQIMTGGGGYVAQQSKGAWATGGAAGPPATPPWAQQGSGTASAPRPPQKSPSNVPAWAR